MSASLQIPALACSVALHTGLIALSLCHFSASFPPQQVVDIDVVKLSSLEAARNEKAIATAIAGKSDVQKPVSQFGMGHPVKTARPRLTKSASLPTSGPQSPRAHKEVAAIVEPVFSAAYLHNTPPAYPDSARREGVEGKVLLKIDVGTDGGAHAVDIQRSSGFSALDNAAQEAVRHWHFIPARRGDEALESSVIVPIEFKLE